MAQPHLSVRGVIYFCWFSAGLLILGLMTYMGFFDGLGDVLHDLLWPIGKFLFQ
jgi:hypothetical protein